MKLRIELFGGIRLVSEGKTISSFRTQKTGFLLGYLACRLGKPQRRDVLIEMFWPDGEDEASRNSLSTALWSLRQQINALGFAADTILPADRAWVQLDPRQVDTDLQRFEEQLTLADAAPTTASGLAHLLTAVKTHHGELLEGCYEDWALREQEHCKSRRRRALLALTQGAAATGDLETALEYADAAAELDPLDQNAARLVMELHVRNGRKDLATRCFQGLQHRLRQELGVQPDAALRTWMARLDSPEPFDGLATVARRSNELIAKGTRIPQPPANYPLLSEGGAAPLHSPYYVTRPVDYEFRQAIAASTSIVLLKGPRQTGKSSLMARGLGQARSQGSRVVFTDLQTLTASQFQTLDAFLMGLADVFSEQLGLTARSRERWDSGWSASLNFRHFLRTAVMEAFPEHLVWGLDEADRLFPHPFAADVFGLFRSWHNERAFDPNCAWSRLTLVIAYATEAHLFVADLNQSPFNVGTRLELEDFTSEEVAELNHRCGSPLPKGEALDRFTSLVGGQPYLAHRGLLAIAAQRISVDELEAQADAATAFADHLRRLLVALRRDPELCEMVREVLRGRPCPSEEGFYRLRSAGILRGDRPENARPRCRLYASYLQRQL